MDEFEVKILEIDKNYLIEKIVKLGGEKIFDGNIEASFLKNNEGKKIRIRKKGNKNILTYKERIENKNEIIQNIEYEVNFENYENLIKIFNNLGFFQYGNSSKYRISYKLGEIYFDFDKYEFIPDFVEIEANNLENLKKGVEILGYKMSQTNNMTERKLKEFYGIIYKF